MLGDIKKKRVTRKVEDYDLFMRLYAIGYQSDNIQKPLLRYSVSIQGMKKKKIDSFIELMRQECDIEDLKNWDYYLGE